MTQGWARPFGPGDAHLDLHERAASLKTFRAPFAPLIATRTRRRLPAPRCADDQHPTAEHDPHGFPPSVRDPTSGQGPLSPLQAFRPALAAGIALAPSEFRAVAVTVFRPTEQCRCGQVSPSVRWKRRPGGHRARLDRRYGVTLVSSTRPVQIVHTHAPLVRTSPSSVPNWFCEGSGALERR